jgi:hypothetical protein
MDTVSLCKTWLLVKYYSLYDGDFTDRNNLSGEYLPTAHRNLTSLNSIMQRWTAPLTRVTGFMFVTIKRISIILYPYSKIVKSKRAWANYSQVTTPVHHNNGDDNQNAVYDALNWTRSFSLPFFQSSCSSWTFDTQRTLDDSVHLVLKVDAGFRVRRGALKVTVSEKLQCNTCKQHWDHRNGLLDMSSTSRCDVTYKEEGRTCDEPL